LSAVLKLYLDKKIKPVIGKEYNLADISKAHSDLAKSATYGKVVLDCRV
ncbi:MAG: zinc-binding dehydrogenase, partial [Leptospirales bacterium]